VFQVERASRVRRQNEEILALRDPLVTAVFQVDLVWMVRKDKLVSRVHPADQVSVFNYRVCSSVSGC
jgi:hypothetical protein